MTSSRPASLALYQISSSTYISPPSLQDILSNTAPPPWSLAAFMAFLSQNHCLETLEFTMDAERYRAAHSEIMTGDPAKMRDGNDHVCTLWQKLMNAYILPCGPRELNIPSPVRDRLLGLPATSTPPDPSELDDAVRIVYELMNDSVLVPFLQAVAPHNEHQGHDEKEAHDSRQRRSILRGPKDSTSSSDDSSRSPKAHFLPLFGLSRSNEPGSQSSPSTDAAELGLSDDCGSVGSPHNEPVTPPTTPPTPDWNAAGPLQRAISAHNSGWKKVGQKLGINRKSRGKRQSTSVTSGVPDPDVSRSGTTSSGGGGGGGGGSGVPPS